jgi:hypothetical protein
MVLSSGSPISPILLGSAGAATLLALTLVALQSDEVGRRFLLSPKQLQAKRAAEYQYRWKQALARAVFRFQYVADKLGLITKSWDDSEQIDKFCSELVSGGYQDIQVIRIGSEESSSEWAQKEFSKEHFVWFLQGNTVHRLPLSAVATQVADQMEIKISTTTFCFVSDASAHEGSHLIVDLVESVYKDDIHVIQQPYWMACLAVLIQQRVYTRQRLERLLYALCRVEALRCKTSTLLITLPGQSIVSSLLPLLQRVFPDDRHVFCYTGCLKTVANAVALRKSAKNPSVVPTDTQEALNFADPTVSTTPLLSISSSTNVMEPAFGEALARLPVSQADVVETWLTAVDSYLVQKKEDKTFLPYCCKLDFLYAQPISTSGPRTSSYWALRSLLQYITGSRSRGDVTVSQMELAVSCVNARVSAPHFKNANIENAVFRHKLVLIENKTLFDTVLPAEHWTLKAAVKQGCACCLPEEDEDAEGVNALGDSISGFAAGLTRRKNAYVDGKSTFAFDPTRFRN